MAKKKVFSIGNSLSDGLEQTIAAAQNYSTALRIDVIPLKKIELDPENPRSLSVNPEDIIHGLSLDDPNYLKKKEDIDDLHTLSLSIQEQGIINPILVYEKNGMYRLIAGERRTLASLLAKKTDIQAKIIDEKPDELKIRLLQWIENIERSDLSLSDRMDNLEKIVNAFAIKQNILPQDVRITDISKLIGCTKPHAINLKSVLNARPEIKTLINENKIRNLEKAAVLTSIESNALRDRAIKECIEGATLNKLKQYIEKNSSKSKLDSFKLLENSRLPIINFGSTQNINVAKMVFDSIIQNENFETVTANLVSIDTTNPKLLTLAFVQLIEKLEKIYE